MDTQPINLLLAENTEHYSSEELLDYANLIKQKIKELKETYAAIESEVKAALISMGDSYQHPDFVVYFSERKTWEYSPKVQKLQTQIQELKKQEIESGAATIAEIKQYIVFRKPYQKRTRFNW